MSGHSARRARPQQTSWRRRRFPCWMTDSPWAEIKLPQTGPCLLCACSSGIASQKITFF